MFAELLNIKDCTVVKFLTAFSAYSNAKKIFHMANNSGDQLQCIHAIRTLSFSWVVLGHTTAFGLSIISKPINNILKIYNILKFILN
jgi:hypothetical protein